MQTNLSYPLSGVRVVSIEQAIAVPLATRHLVDLGAEVVKIERPQGGDFARDYDSLAGGLSVHFAWTNRGKKSVVLDLKVPAGLSSAKSLIADSQVFVHNLGPGAIERLGLGQQAMFELAPELVVVELAGYGDGAGMENRKAYDLLVQSETGASAVSGTEDQPAKIGISIVDIAGAMYVTNAVLAALLGKSNGGEGRWLKLSLFDAVAEWMSIPLLQAKYQGRFTRSGRFHNSIYPYGPFTCADGEIVIAVQNDAEWGRFCREVIGDENLYRDQRFTSNEQRHRNRSELSPILASVLASLAKREVMERLESADVPFAESRRPEDVVSHPELIARGRWRAYSSEFGPVDLLRSPLDCPGGWPTPTGGVPALGEHTLEYLDEFYGHS